MEPIGSFQVVFECLTAALNYHCGEELHARHVLFLMPLLGRFFFWLIFFSELSGYSFIQCAAHAFLL